MRTFKVGPKGQIPNNLLKSKIELRELPKFLRSRITALSSFSQATFTQQEKTAILKKLKTDIMGKDTFWEDTNGDTILEEYLTQKEFKGINFEVRFYLRPGREEKPSTIIFSLSPIIRGNFGAFEADLGPREKLLT